MDFTLSKYKELLENLLRAGFSFQTFEHFLTNPLPKTIVLRHEVDFSKVLYQTDTCRRWDDEKVSVRDKPMDNGQLIMDN